jgi:4-hydroxy-tetrahydrodipicolinate synthase
MSLKKVLSGTGVAIVTPFKKDMSVDDLRLKNLIDHVIENGVEYIVTMGTTGETPTISKEEKKEIIALTVAHIAGRVPFVVGVGGNDTLGIIKELADFHFDSATAILSASPYYNKPSQAGIIAHYKMIAAASPKPIILYNVPGRTGRNMTAETTLTLAQVPNICGMKEASGDMVQCMHILEKAPADFLVVSGDDHITLPCIAAGMDGVISVAANCFAKDFSNMVRFCLQGNFDAAKPLHYKLLQGMDLLFAENNPAGVKAFLSEMNLIENHLRMPMMPLSENLHMQVKAYLKTLN